MCGWKPYLVKMMYKMNLGELFTNRHEKMTHTEARDHRSGMTAVATTKTIYAFLGRIWIFEKAGQKKLKTL